MINAEPDSQELVRRAAAGDGSAAQKLLSRQRRRLKSMISVRMDRRLASRIDPSDVVQETLIEAARQLPEYLRNPALPFYPWIRQLAMQQLIRQHRRHLRAKARSLRREQQHALPLPDHSAIELAVRLLAGSASPSQQALIEELRTRVRTVLSKLDEQDREVLVLRFLEQLSVKETAAVLGLTANGVKSRQARAMERFSRLFGDSSAEDQP